ncbi:MAG: DUF839 domain-containing protein [Planctomycetes bacterium]|jgi:hypothetical protein|nr:DUF839 domain-containing protein [Planctomycetota bacterium]
MRFRLTTMSVLLLTLVLATGVAGAAEECRRLTISDTAPVDRIEIDPLVDQKGNGKKFTGNATLYLDDASEIALTAVRTLIKPTGNWKFTLKSLGSSAPKAMILVETNGDQTQVLKLKLLLKLDPMVSQKDPSKGTIGGCPQGGDGAIEFVEVPTPTTDLERRSVLASPSVDVDGKSHTIDFETILRSGEQRGTGIFGLLYNKMGEPLQQADGSLVISNDNDHSTLLDVHGKLFMMSQFESRPAAFYLTEMHQNADSGKLTALSTKPVDFSAVEGGWVHCAGSRTPWRTHLGSEEYEPDARYVDPVTGLRDGENENGYYRAMARYFGNTPDGEDPTRCNPYDYGYVVEATVTGPDMGIGTFAANVDVQKHYCMGRLAVELAYVMPDEKTAYITDDGTMVGLFKFVADQAGDLSSGSLFAAKLTQTSATNGGRFDIDWILLGSASDAEIRNLINTGGAGGGKITFADIFDATNAVKNPDGTYSAPAGYTGISHGHEAQGDGTFNECLDLQPGMEKAAAFLETRRYAALLGATMEFRKEEGVTFDPVNQKFYIAMSEVSKGMLANADGARSKTEAFSTDDIRVPQNNAGAVYVCDVDASYSLVNMTGLVVGNPNPTGPDYAAGGKYAGNAHDVNAISNPDNVTCIPGYDILIIGEDTGSGHQNDAIWSLDLKTLELTRIQTTPYGSETTSPYFYPNINGWGYMMSVIQHPYGESDSDKVGPGSAERNAYTGYVGPFPALD